MIPLNMNVNEAIISIASKVYAYLFDRFWAETEFGMRYIVFDSWDSK